MKASLNALGVASRVNQVKEILQPPRKWTTCAG